jgi:Domain of unknown function (DUF4129)
MQDGMNMRSSAMSAGRGRLLALPILAVLLLAVAIGATSRAGGTGPTSTDPQASVDASTVILTLLGMSLAMSLGYLAWCLLTADRPGGHQTEKREGVRLRTQLLVLGLVLSVLGGIVAIIFATSPRASRHGQAAALGGSTAVVRGTKALAYSSAVGGITAGTVVVVLLAFFVWWQLRRLSRRRRGQPFLADLSGPEGVVPLPSADHVELSLQEVTVPDPRAEPDPRRAVIAAWLSMTEAIGAQWRPRDPSEAPFEYLAAALTGAGVKPASAHRLTTLFETARWGGRPVGEDVRTEAVAALDQVRADLQQCAATVGAG